MSNPICNTLEFEQLTAPEFDPQKFAENIRAEHTKRSQRNYLRTYTKAFGKNFHLLEFIMKRLSS